MPLFPGMPYGAAPSSCFPLFETGMYILFTGCFIHAIKHGIRHIGYLVGGLLFGLILEYVNVISDMGYTYGKFMVMFGHAPQEIPLCIGVGWAIIMYASRLVSDSFKLPPWPAAAFDTLLAISIDLSMDTVAYRLHMWHWNWAGSGLNPLTADWFGVPFGNFFGWLMVVFFYSSFSRLLERLFLQQKKGQSIRLASIPLLSVLFSQVFLYVMLVYVDNFLHYAFGITSLHRFISFLILLMIITYRGFRKLNFIQSPLPAIAWMVPLWFHLFFFAWLFIGGFYRENNWLVIAGAINLLIAIAVHANTLTKKAVSTSPATNRISRAT